MDVSGITSWMNISLPISSLEKCLSKFQTK